jgi:hypothetical protein
MDHHKFEQGNHRGLRWGKGNHRGLRWGKGNHRGLPLLALGEPVHNRNGGKIVAERAVVRGRKPVWRASPLRLAIARGFQVALDHSGRIDLQNLS